MIKTVILDDDINSHKAAKVALKKYEDIDIIQSFQKSSDLFEFLKNETVDLLFLDIELKGELGLEVAKKIRKQYPRSLIVFFTGHASYAIDGYDFQPVSFLTKPINHEKLERTIQNVRERLAQNQKKRESIQFMFKCMKGYQMIKIKDIYYIEHRNRKNYLMTKDNEQRIANYTVKELEKMLEPYGFFCCHQSFIISLDKIKYINELERQVYTLTLEDKEEVIPMSRNKYEELREKLLENGNMRF